MKKHFFIFLLICIIPTLSIAEETVQKAEESASTTPASTGKWISNGEHLGKWWQKRARKFTSLPPELLYHLDLSYAFAEETGNNIETDIKAKAVLFLRKGLVNSKTTFDLRDQERGSGNHVRTKKRKKLDEFVYIELWEKIDLAADLNWYTYNKRYIEDRYSGFFGLYFTLLDLPDYTLKLGTYYGYATISYMNDKIAQIDPNLYFDDYKSPLYLVKQRFNWAINKSFNFSESFGYYQYTKYDDYFYWLLNLKLTYQITDNIAIFSDYEVEYEDNEVVRSVGGPNGSEKRDSEFNFGITVSF